MSIWYFPQDFRPRKQDWSNADLERTDGEVLSAPGNASQPQAVTTPTVAQLDDAPWFHVLVDVAIGETNHVVVYLDGVASTYRSPDGGGLLEVLRVPAGTAVAIGSDDVAAIADVTVQTAIPRLNEY
jgi:hypothetical protein